LDRAFVEVDVGVVAGEVVARPLNHESAPCRFDISLLRPGYSLPPPRHFVTPLLRQEGTVESHAWKEQFMSAVMETKETTGYETLALYIDGKFIPAEGRKTEPVHNPATGEVLAHLPHASREDLDSALAA